MEDTLLRIKSVIDRYYTEQDYPALYDQIKEWSISKPLAGLSVLDATPVFRNTMTKYMALLAAGADLSVGISEIMPYDGNVVEFLLDTGVKVVTPDDDDQYDLVLDCAGAFSGVKATTGYVELTRSGVEQYRQCTKPVFIADSGQIKKIETLLGTGESLFRALSALGYSHWQGKKMVVFGSGKVGSGIIMYGFVNGAAVTVITDPETVAEHIALQCNAIVDYKDSAAVCKAVSDAALIVTATGLGDAIASADVIQTIIASDALLANMGVEDEFGKKVPAARVLNHKKPLNFTLEEPTHLKYIEATMALHNMGAVYLLQHPCAGGIINPSPKMEQEILTITRTRGMIAKELDFMDFDRQEKR